jgi:cell wall-associated NlpC family hydrolase
MKARKPHGAATAAIFKLDLVLTIYSALRTFMKRHELFSLLLIGCVACTADDPATLQRKLEDRLTQIQNAFVPDRRVEVLDTRVRFENGVWVLSGETTLPGAKQAITQAVDSLLIKQKHQVEIVLLPAPGLGDKIDGLIRVSVANLRKQPKHSAEMVDQLILGTPIRLLNKQDNWYLIQTPYRYIAWLDSAAFISLNQQEGDAWRNSPRQRFEKNYGVIYTQPNAESLPLSDIVMGSVVKKLAPAGRWTRVALPDGREGFLPAVSLHDYAEAFDQRRPRRENLVALAYRLSGVPYLWGGNSAKGFDCSGFTQTVFKMNDRLLPRDANQQVKTGMEIVPDEKFSNVLPGDLLFFGQEDRITHVGISLGGAQFIHANGISGDVHVNSLNPAEANYSASRKSTFKHVRRILN